MIYLLSAIGLSSDGSTHLHTNNTQNNTNNNWTTQRTNNVEECGPCPVFASFTLAFALQLRKKHGKTSVMVRQNSVRLIKTSVMVRQTLVRTIKTSVSIQYTYYQNTHTLQNLSQCTVHILPKHPHITKSQSVYSTHITKTPTH